MCADSDDSPFQGLHHRFGATFRVELLIDVGDMVAERAHADTKLPRHFLRGFTRNQKLEDFFLLDRQRNYRGQLTCLLCSVDQAPGYPKDVARQLLGLFPPFDVAHQVNDQAPLSLFVVGHQQRDVDPYTPPRAGGDLHVKVGNVQTCSDAFNDVAGVAA